MTSIRLQTLLAELGSRRVRRRKGEPAHPSDQPARGTVWHARIRWFAAEFLVVVAGVLVALALNAWWQGRTEQAHERAYLLQLLEDFRANEDEVALAISRETEVWASADRLYRAAHLSPPHSDSARLWLAGSLLLPSFRLRTATWDALTHSGQISLIRNDALRSRLIAFAGEVAYVADRVDKLTDAGMEQITLVVRGVDQYELAAEQFRSRPGWEDAASVFPVNWDVLLGDREFVGTVRILGMAAQGRSIVIGGLERPIREILVSLESELSR